ncbi:Histone-lysine N-methyltransferase SETMAR [Eumeta japonica]|uniref:Histone-lysine N-methyltransferase SETMAR n=1 Tax=Eumeta variegata TaxID=151549 RepID=A0A4C1WW59_EUMVA|nr:Histone-lysine N-methyltransferase SETMAR [Eumeta japonica]
MTPLKLTKSERENHDKMTTFGTKTKIEKPEKCLVQGAHALLLRISKYAGLAPLKFEPHAQGWVVSVSTSVWFYSYTLITVLLINTLWTIIQDVQLDMEYSVRMNSSLGRGVVIVDILIIVVNACLGIYAAPMRMRKMMQYTSVLNEIRGAADKSAAQAESSNLSNIEHRAVIKYFVKKGKTPKEIFEDMVSVLQESAPSYTMVKKWARLFQQGRESCEDDPRPGRPVTIAEELQISKKRVGEIIHEHMNMGKISARWVPKMLTPFDKQRRLQTSKDFLELVGDNIDEICDRIVTVDETWVRQYDPESKQESMQWTKKGERPPKKFKVPKSASKLMATIFWDSEGVLLIDYLPKGTTMNGQYYANLLAQEREAVVQKRRGKLSRGVLFLQDNASVHTVRVSRQALKDTGFSEIDHPPYSPDLAPSDYFLFSNLKKELRGRRFVDDNQMKMAVESHFDCKEKEYFLGGLKALYTRCEKCISLEGDYIEK